MDTTLQSIADARSRVLSFIPEVDRPEAQQAIDDLISAQAAADTDAVEVCVPSRSVERTLDIGSVCLKDTGYGVLFQAKGSLTTLIDPRQIVLTDLLRQLITLGQNDFADVSADLRPDYQAYLQAWITVLQAPLFCVLDAGACADVATLLLRVLIGSSDKMLSEPLSEPTPDTASADAAFLNAAEALAADQHPIAPAGSPAGSPAGLVPRRPPKRPKSPTA